MTNRLEIPPSLEGYSYTGNATWRTNGVGSEQILDVTLKFVSLDISTTTSIVLGQNVQWVNSTLKSYSSNSVLTAQKNSDGTIAMSFGGSEAQNLVSSTIDHMISITIFLQRFCFS